MPVTLEQRRRAIAAALRAVMAEPLPPPPPVMAAPELLPTPPPAAPVVPPKVETIEFDAPAEPARRSLRDALTAEIDWEDEDDEWESPSVPPIDTGGSMSEAASMALFGHA